MAVNSWIRLWVDFPSDPKWRTISRLSGQPMIAVKAVAVDLMLSAANATERGRTRISDEDLASQNDLSEEAVQAIRAAMQERFLTGDMLSGWERRQPLREDDSAARSKRWREEKKAERERTQENAPKRPDSNTDTDTDTDSKEEIGGKPPTTPSAGAPVGDEIPVVTPAAPSPTPLPQPPAPPAPPPGRRPAIDMANRALMLPDWLAPHADAWRQFEENRWAKHTRAPYTLAAQRGIVSKLQKLRDEGQDLDEVLMASVRNSWTDVFAQRGAPAGAGGGTGRFAAAATGVLGGSGFAGKDYRKGVTEDGELL